MTALLYTLQRHRDISGVSGKGPVATVCEFNSGLTVIHWDSKTPSVAVHTDVRHIEDLHGHGGASTLELFEPHRLLAAYQVVTPRLLDVYGTRRPVTVAPHPDHPDRLRITFDTERAWRFWVALLDGSSDAATHEEVNGETQHTWITPDGNVWLQYFSGKNAYPDHDAHDPRD